MRTVLAGCVVVALSGCLDDVFDSLEKRNVCMIEDGDGGLLCYEAAYGSNTIPRLCGEESALFSENSTCADLDITEPCLEEEDLSIFGDTPETCAAFDSREPEMPAPSHP